MYNLEWPQTHGVQNIDSNDDQVCGNMEAEMSSDIQSLSTTSEMHMDVETTLAWEANCLRYGKYLTRRCHILYDYCIAVGSSVFPMQTVPKPINLIMQSECNGPDVESYSTGCHGQNYRLHNRGKFFFIHSCYNIVMSNIDHIWLNSLIVDVNNWG